MRVHISAENFCKKIPMRNLLFALLVTAFLTVVGRVEAQIQIAVGDAKVDGFEVEVQQTPSFSADGVKGKNIPNPRDWLELEVEFEVKGPKDVVIPELLFRYYVGFKDQAGQARTLTGDVTHTNVLFNETYFSAAYVAPSKLGELTGDFRKFQKSSMSAYGVEIYYNGVIVGGFSSLSGSSAKFWTVTGTEAGVQAKGDTPFALLWIDRYAESKKR